MKPILWLLAALLLTASCQDFSNLDEVTVVNDDTEYAVPLVEADLSLTELLENFDQYTFVEVGPDGFITLRYQGDIITQTSEDIFGSIANLLSLPLFIDQPIDTLPFSSPDQLEIDEMEVKSGRIAYSLTHSETEDVTVMIRFPQVLRDGAPVTTTTVVPYDGDAPSSTPMPFPDVDIAGTRIEPLDGKLLVEHTATLPDGTTIELDQFIMQIQDFKFFYAEGYLGSEPYDAARDTIPIEFFENWTRGEVYFEDPVIDIVLTNSFGVPTQSVVEIFRVLTAEGERLDLESVFIDQGFPFDYPELDEVGETRTTIFRFDKTNSNIDEILGSNPVALEYDVNAVTNPTADPDIRGFITDSSFYRVSVDVELPLYGRASDFTVTDTFAVSFSDYEEVASVEFKLVTDNALPVGIDLQGYFVDPDGTVLDSLLANTDRLIVPTDVDANGDPVGTQRSEVFIPMDAARFARLRTADYILVRAAFSTTDNGTESVRIYADDAVRIGVGMKLRLAE